MSSMMVLTYALLFLFDVVLLALMLLVFAEKRRIRKDMSKLLDSESSVAELTRSMEHLIDEYKRVASGIQDDTSAKRDELMRTIQRADRLLMELVKRSDRFELAAASSKRINEGPPKTHQEREAAAAPKISRPAERTAAAQKSSIDRTAPERARPATGAQDRILAQAPSTAGSESPSPRHTRVESVGVRRKSPQEAPVSKRRGVPPAGSEKRKDAPPVASKKTSASRARPFVTVTEKEQTEPDEAASNEKEMVKTKKLVMDLSRQGLNVETIARSLRVPVSQVKLILEVQKSKRS